MGEEALTQGHMSCFPQTSWPPAVHLLPTSPSKASLQAQNLPVFDAQECRQA